jgi:hypothetical protein
MSPRASLHDREEKIVAPHWESNSDSLGCPAHSQFLYRLHYPSSPIHSGGFSNLKEE